MPLRSFIGNPTRTALAASSALLLVACGTDYMMRTRLSATLWTRTSGEYAAAALQAYAVAAEKLPEALADPEWTAYPAQTGDYRELPPAIIVDVDETVLDNTPFHAMLDEKGLEFDEALWADWVEQRESEAVPGAVGFLRSAAERNVAVFYVTNRDHSLEPATRDNLKAVDLPLDEESDVVLTRNERPGWGRDKESRRAAVAETHRVIMLVGDALGDFASAQGFSSEQRRQLAFQYRGFWGRKWFVLPNPIYGGWERGVLPFDLLVPRPNPQPRD